LHCAEGSNPRNLALVYYIIDFLGTFDSWGLGDLLDTLNNILSSSQDSQRIIRFMCDASPHIYGGSWVMMKKSRIALGQKKNRTFSDVQRSLNLYPELLDEVPELLDEIVKDYANKCLLDLYQTVTAAEYRMLLKSIERKCVVLKCLPHLYSSKGTQIRKVNLFYLSKRKRTFLMDQTRQFWDVNIIAKMQMWMNHGLEPVELVRGLWQFGSLGMYPSVRVVDAFLEAARQSEWGIDGDEEIGQTVQQTRGSRRRRSVSVFEYFLVNGISARNLHILGPRLSAANSEVVEYKFSKMCNLGHQNRKWKNYRSLLEYGFKVNVGQLHVKNRLKKSLEVLINQKHPREVKDRALYLYYYLKMACNVSDLPITTIFAYVGISEHITYARNRLESKRVRAENYCRRLKRKRGLEIANDDRKHKRQRTACMKSSNAYQMIGATKTVFGERTSNTM